MINLFKIRDGINEILANWEKEHLALFLETT